MTSMSDKTISFQTGTKPEDVIASMDGVIRYYCLNIDKLQMENDELKKRNEYLENLLIRTCNTYVTKYTPLVKYLLTQKIDVTSAELEDAERVVGKQDELKEVGLRIVAHLRSLVIKPQVISAEGVPVYDEFWWNRYSINYATFYNVFKSMY